MKCTNCDGKGMVESRYFNNDGGETLEVRKCSTCHGTGRV